MMSIAAILIFGALCIAFGGWFVILAVAMLWAVGCTIWANLLFQTSFWMPADGNTYLLWGPASIPLMIAFTLIGCLLFGGFFKQQGFIK